MPAEKFITEEGLQQAQDALRGLDIPQPYERKLIPISREMSYKEVAAELELTETKVKNIEYNAIQKLRKNKLCLQLIAEL